MLLSRVIVVSLLACSSSSHAPEALAAPSPPKPICEAPPAGTAPLFLPSLTADPKLRLEVHAPNGVKPEDYKGKLVVDGTVTSALWPEHAPAAYPLPDGRFMLYDSYNANLGYLWDPTTRKLTELGKVGIESIVGRGWMIARHDNGTGARTLHDIDPDRKRPGLRRVWEAKGALTQSRLAGVIDGVVVAIARDYTSSGPAPEVTLVCLQGPGAVTTHRATVPSNLVIANDDALRDHRLLLTGFGGETVGSPQDWSKPFSVGVSILDLDTMRVRSIGKATGGWTVDTNVPHRYLDVRWDDGAAATTKVLRERTKNVVDPKTEKIAQR
jgi:hypothetical protein